MQLDAGQWIVIGICAILIVWYMGGYYYNRQRAEQVLTWLRSGLSPWGKVTPGERLSGMSTGGRLNVGQASAPFRRIEAIYVLDPRENLPFLIFHRLLGKQDELILKIDFRTAPLGEVEVGRRGNREFTRLISASLKKPFEVVSGSGGLEIAKQGKHSDLDNQRLHTFLERYGRAITRLSQQRKSPHLFLRAHLSVLKTSPAEDFFSSLSSLAE